MDQKARTKYKWFILKRELFLGNKFYPHYKLIFSLSTSANSFSIKRKLHLFASSLFESSLVKILSVVFGSQKSPFFLLLFFPFLILLKKLFLKSYFPWRLALP